MLNQEESHSRTDRYIRKEVTEIGGQTSALSTSSMDFRFPELKEASSTAVLNTVGGQQVTITGDRFGDDKLVFSGTYGRAGALLMFLCLFL